MFLSKQQEDSSQVTASNTRRASWRRETMANDAHRTNVLVTSCLKTPVDPLTKAPVALYERERAVPCGPYSTMTTGPMRRHNLDFFQREMEYSDSGSEFGDRESSGRRDSSPLMIKDYRVAGDHLDLREIFFSNEEYYSKLEELKKAHLRTMAELEGMYRRNLQLKSTAAPLDAAVETGPRLPWVKGIPDSLGLRKFHSAIELRRESGLSWTLLDTSDDEEANAKDTEKGLLSSPKDHIKNMWKDFKLSHRDRHPSVSSLQSLPSESRRTKGRGKKKQGRKESGHRFTVPEPFHMTMREAEKHRRGFKTRSEIEHENAELRKQLDELTECQRKFRASPLPAHVRLPLYEELRERDEERRRSTRERRPSVPKPFSFLERERLKREQREEQLRHLQPSDQETVKPFKAKPVPKSVYEAATGEQMKEEQLYRAIKMQMRAKEMLCSSSMPPSMLAQRLSERKTACPVEEDSHRPQINKEVPDFDASYRRFQKHMESRKEVRPVTACEPFQLRTSQISSHRERILADIEKGLISPRLTRWPGAARTPNSSLCSSLSGSLELLPGKVTDTAKKRQEAVRKVLEQRKKAEEDEETWREKRKQKEKNLQKVVLKRAQANDPHLALSQTNQNKLKEFRKQDLLRKREYQQEIREIQERVKGRPLLLEQVAQRNAKLAAEKRYTDALRSCGLSEDFISSKVPKSLRPGSHSPGRKSSLSTESRQSDKEEPDMGYIPVRFRKVYLDDEDSEAGSEERDKLESGKEEEDDGTNPGSADGEDAGHGDAHNYSDDDDHYSDDHENDSDNSEKDLTEERHQDDDDLITQLQSSRSNQHSRNSQGSDRESTV